MANRRDPGDAVILKPLDWVLRRSVSAFNALIFDRRRRGDAPFDPTRVFMSAGTEVGLVEWPDGRWLVLPLMPMGRGRR